MTDNTHHLDLLPNDLKIAKQLLYDTLGFAITKLTLHPESKEYGACSFILHGKQVQYRMAKITPKKVGQFVTTWKRNQSGITAPFDSTDELDYIIISARSAGNFGQFIFPKSILAKKGIITHNNKEGKRGIRVYPPWDTPTNKQAAKTQQWQQAYFFSIQPGDIDLLDLSRIVAQFAE